MKEIRGFSGFNDALYDYRGLRNSFLNFNSTISLSRRLIGFSKSMLLFTVIVSWAIGNIYGSWKPVNGFLVTSR